MSDKNPFHYFQRSAVITCVSLAVLIGVFFPSGEASAHPIHASKSLPFSLSGPFFRYQSAVKADATDQSLPCLASPTPPRCYSPQQIRTAYGIQPLLDAGITGQHRTIVIIDPFQSPTIVSDLQLFDQLFGLPDPELHILTPFGLAPFNPQDPQQTASAGEISLDVEWAHAIAPAATIDLVLANPVTSNVPDILSALADVTTYAVEHNLGGVISQSFGLGESCFGQTLIEREHQAFQQARARGITVLASSGDNGAAAPICDSAGNLVTIGQGVMYPASDPLVLSVGGTTLDADVNTGQYRSETAWTQPAVSQDATGGGFSGMFPRPAYQIGIADSATGRGVPDVAYNADFVTGVETVTSSLVPGTTLIVPAGGTSAGSPQWAGIIALLDQLAGENLGFLNPALYRINASPFHAQAFHDITTGNNTFRLDEGNGTVLTVPGFEASAGWDPTTGVGSPRAADLAVLVLKAEPTLKLQT